MQGLIFVTWEKFLLERFGAALLNAYRAAIGETAATAPLTSRVYDDETLLAGVKAGCELTGLSANMILREYGRYFVMNALTNHLCAYLLTRVKSGRELLLAMRDAHAQMRRTPDALTPPIFSYEALSSNPNDIALIYDSPRQLCPVLLGAIEGAAERYGEQVQIIERTCMKRGAEVCRFEIAFRPKQRNQAPQLETPEQMRHRRTRQQLANIVLAALPIQEGMTLLELQKVLQNMHIVREPLRPSVVLEALHHLQFVGLAASSTNKPGEDMMQRRYWRAPTTSIV